jgi:hypothetical protein
MITSYVSVILPPRASYQVIRFNLQHDILLTFNRFNSTLP